MQYFGFDRPSFAFKTFGFGESNSKLSADFTTGAYNSNGAAKTFADLFTFSRAGKAWLIKDTGLQEYAADVPRLDNGLLIEQSATNIATWALQPDKWLSGVTYTYHKNIDGNNTAVTATRHTAGVNGINLIATSVTTSAMYYGSGAPQTPTDFSLLLRNGATGINLTKPTISDGSFQFVEVVDINTYKVFYTWSSGFTQGDNLAIYQGTSSGTVGAVTRLSARQITPDTIMSSLIKTEATPVTRPADYLLNKITGTTVTGDWDSTLNLSIVAGQLVHSGYGRIRSLEIN